ncbi:MAG: hypothetical protein HY223_02465 [Thaumarchaeota archaeon]|nr:hypothetical protein [Nitrososphaerota archaeon]
MLDFKKIIDEMTSVSDKVRFILVIGENGKVVSNKIMTKSFLVKENQAIMMATDMHVLKQLLKLYDEIIGKNTFAHLIREKVHVLIFYVKDWIFLISCDRNMSRREIADMSDRLESIIDKYI